jgi:hypothetical protein
MTFKRLALFVLPLLFGVLAVTHAQQQPPAGMAIPPLGAGP